MEHGKREGLATLQSFAHLLSLISQMGRDWNV
jgi:hypothetical protein